MTACMVLTGNSMGSSEIWDKYHSCCIGNGKFHLASPREIYPHFRLVKFIPISNTTRVVFIPNFTATHAITSTNLRAFSMEIVYLN